MSMVVARYLLLAALGAATIPNAMNCTRPGGRKAAVLLPTVTAAGTVRHHGRPVPGVGVVFVGGDGRVSARAVTGPDGTFTLSTYRDGDGLPVGRYKAVIAWEEWREVEPGVYQPAAPPPALRGVSPAYADPATTPLTVDVTPAGPNRFVLDLR